MARGFLSGAVWGTVICAGGLAAVSLTAPLPERVSEPPSEPVALAPAPGPEQTPEPETEAAAEPEAQTGDTPAPGIVVFDESASGVEAPEQRQVDPATRPVDESSIGAGGTAPAMSTPSDDDTAPSVEGLVAPTPVPEIGQDEVALGAPASGAASPGEAVLGQAGDASAGDGSIGATGPAPSMSAPAGSDTAPTVEITTSPVPVPETGQEEPVLAAPSADPQSPDVNAPGQDEDVPTGDLAQKPAGPEAEGAPTIVTTPAQPPAPVVPEDDSGLVAQDAPQTSEPDEKVEAEQPTRPTVRRINVAPTEEDTEEITQENLRPTIGTRATPFTERNSGSTGRLPTLGDATQDQITADAVDPALAVDAPPLRRFAMAVDVDIRLPKMAIILIDDGTGPLGPDTLDTLPFPVTFAIDPTSADASARMAAYRSNGHEVAVVARLPQIAAAQDVEQALAGAVSVVPESVALIEAPGAASAATRGVADQATAFAADSGHGLIFLPNGLNTAEAIARREGVASVTIFRDFDSDGQDARTKRRFLDGAAFRARQDGSAVVLGRLTPDTISALLLWGLQDRASQVAMVPVSAVLIESIDDEG